MMNGFLAQYEGVHGVGLGVPFHRMISIVLVRYDRVVDGEQRPARAMWP